MQKDGKMLAAVLLHWGALDRAERAEHAAIARLGTQQCVARTALVERDSGVSLHRFALCESALGARQQRLKNWRAHCAYFLAARFLGLAATCGLGGVLSSVRN